jgi:hypothetical protein
MEKIDFLVAKQVFLTLILDLSVDLHNKKRELKKVGPHWDMH